MWKLSFAVSAGVSLLALPMSHAQAQTAPGGATPLEEITVEGRGTGLKQGEGAVGVFSYEGYVAKSGRTATKTDTPVNETPQTISTVTRRQLEDRKPQSLQEALGYTPGAQVGLFGFDPRFDAFKIRGVDVTYTGVFRDGLRQFNSPNGVFRLEPYGLEAVSILKGPSSAIYGASASAGIVDLISKRPTDYTFGEVEAQAGSFDRIQGAFDIGGPANEAGTVLYRLTGVGRNAGTELGAVNDDRVFIAPAITFKPNDDTRLTILSEYMDSLTGGSAAYQNDYDPTFQFSLGARRKQLPFKDFNDFRQQQGRIGYELEHRFNEFVTLHQNVRFSALGTRQEYSGSQFFSTGLIKERVQGTAADTYLVTEAATGPVEHKILTGVDASYLKYDSKMAFGSFTDPEDIPEPSFDNPDPNFTEKSKQNQTLVGVYAQDELKYDAWRLLIGGRYDWFDSDFRSGSFASKPYDGRQKQDDGKLTGRVGLSYVTAFGVTPYVSYGTSFVPNPGTVIGGSVAKPTTGETAEAGVKYAIPGTNASINASVFTLKQTDGIVYAVEGGANLQKQLDFRSRGFEIEGVASLSNGVSLQASYTYTDTNILKLNDATKGNSISGIPAHAVLVWADYKVPTGPAKGFGLGAGVRYLGGSSGDELSRAVIRNEPRAFVDAKVSYELENLNPKLKGVKLQVNATNLLDDVKQFCSSNYCYYDEGRKVIASLRYRW